MTVEVIGFVVLQSVSFVALAIAYVRLLRVIDKVGLQQNLKQLELYAVYPIEVACGEYVGEHVPPFIVTEETLCFKVWVRVSGYIGISECREIVRWRRWWFQFWRLQKIDALQQALGLVKSKLGRQRTIQMVEDIEAVDKLVDEL